MRTSTPCQFIRSALALLRGAAARLRCLRMRSVYFGRSLSRVPCGSLVLFPLRRATLGCGIAGIVAFKPPRPASASATPRKTAEPFPSGASTIPCADWPSRRRPTG